MDDKNNEKVYIYGEINLIQNPIPIFAGADGKPYFAEQDMDKLKQLLIDDWNHRSEIDLDDFYGDSFMSGLDDNYKDCFFEFLLVGDVLSSDEKLKSRLSSVEPLGYNPEDGWAECRALLDMPLKELFREYLDDDEMFHELVSEQGQEKVARTFSQDYVINAEYANNLEKFLMKVSMGKEQLTEDETETFTVPFSDGRKMDVKICGTGGTDYWMEAVLFDENGSELCHTDPCDENSLYGEWMLEYDGKAYTVNMIDGRTLERGKDSDIEVKNMMPEDSFDREGFCRYMSDTFNMDRFAREMAENIIDYGIRNLNHGKDDLAYFISDIIPEVEFKEVAGFCDDQILTDTGKAAKQEFLKDKQDDYER